MARKQLSTIAQGINRDAPPMRLYEKAKRLGIWNPSDLDFTQDRLDWQRLADDERDVLLRLTAMFQGGEEAVTLDLLPLIMTVASEGRLEEEMFLTTFLWEEAKHTDFFARFLAEVLEVDGQDLSSYHGESYKILFYDILPQALNRLMTDQSPAAQVQAAVTYNMIVEGVLAETGYHAYFTMLKDNGLMPGQTEGIRLLQQDESRHIAYGIYLISRLVAEHEEVWQIAENTMNNLLAPAIGVINEIFALYDPVPFGLDLDQFVGYAMMQYQKRFARIEAARGKTPGEVEAATQTVIDTGDI